MSTLTHSDVLHGSALERPTARAAAAILRIVRAVSTEMRLRRATRELRELDDRMLADIGLERRAVGPAARFGHDGLLAERPGG